VPSPFAGLQSKTHSIKCFLSYKFKYLKDSKPSINTAPCNHDRTENIINKITDLVSRLDPSKSFNSSPNSYYCVDYGLTTSWRKVPAYRASRFSLRAHLGICETELRLDITFSKLSGATVPNELLTRNSTTIQLLLTSKQIVLNCMTYRIQNNK
jgi:hypothetical protein